MRELIEIVRAFLRGYRRGREKRRAIKSGQHMTFAMDAGAEATGKSIGEKLALEFKNKDWKGVGADVGNALWTGFTTALGAKIEAFLIGDPKTRGINFDPQHGALWQFIINALKSDGWQFGQGGTVPGAPGEPHLAVVHGGERVLTPEQQRSGGRGNTVSITINGATDTAETERAVRRALVDALGMV